MANADPHAPATWFRLSPESWAKIGAAYKRGETAKRLAQRWKVSPSSIYRHASAEGWTKYDNGDDIARESVAADEARLKEADRREREERYEMERVFEPFMHDAEEGEFVDAAWLGHGALQASSLLLARGKPDEALKYARMAETYFRIAPQAQPLMLQYTVDALVSWSYANKLFEKKPGEFCIVKDKYWKHFAAECDREGARKDELDRLRGDLRSYEAAYGPLPGSQAASDPEQTKLTY